MRQIAATTEPTDLMTIPEAAAELDCSIRTIRRLMSAGKLLTYKIMGLRRISRGQLRRLIANSEMVGNTPLARVFDVDEDLEAVQIIAQAMRIDACSGIYFLTLEDQIVYVGKSNMVWRRIAQHMIEKRFDSYYVLECPLSELSKMERKYIKKFQPKLNINGVTSHEPRNVTELKIA